MIIGARSRIFRVTYGSARARRAIPGAQASLHPRAEGPITADAGSGDAGFGATFTGMPARSRRDIPTSRQHMSAR
jgi:hypothetical protein